jgi:hypothetical protein
MLSALFSTEVYPLIHANQLFIMTLLFNVVLSCILSCIDHLEIHQGSYSFQSSLLCLYTGTCRPNVLPAGEAYRRHADD